MRGEIQIGNVISSYFIPPPSAFIPQESFIQFARRRHYGQHVRLGDDAARGGDAGTIRRAVRVARRVGAPHTGVDDRVRDHG